MAVESDRHAARRTLSRLAATQFGLRELLIWFTLAAVVMSLWTWSPKSFGPYAAWLLCFAVACRCLSMRNWPPPTGGRRKQHSRRFWLAFWVTIPIAACLSLITYWQTYGAYCWDGLESIGWPLPVRSYGGGSVLSLDYYPVNFFVDCAVIVSIAAATGFVLKDRGRWVCVQLVKIIRGRSFLKFRMG